MGVQDGIKTGVKAGLGGLGLDIEAKIGNLEVSISQLDERVKGLQEYLRCPMFTPRLLEGVGNVQSGLPLVLDLGTVSPGLMWSVEGVATGFNDPANTSFSTAAPAGGIIASIFVGRPAVSGTNAAPLTSIGNAIVASLPVPSYMPLGGRRAIVRGGAHLYVVVGGSVAAGQQYFASASVTEAVDTPEALTWF